LNAFSKPLQHLLAIVLIIMMAQSLAQLTWLPFRQWQSDLPVMPAKLNEKQGQRIEIAALATGNLFGQLEGAGVKAEVLSQVDAPQTKLQLMLEGVFIADREKDSGAIISQRGKEGEFYLVGQKLPGGAEMVGVFPDRVVLRRQGQLETLSFEDVLAARDTVKAVEQPRVSSPEEFVALAQRQLSENPDTALASVGLKPAGGGTADGYVYDGNNPMLRSLNLQKGDVIRSVNGHVLGDVKTDRELIKEFSQQEMLEVEVERGGARFTVSYPLRQN